MRRRRRFTLKLIALGFATAAIGAPTAQAMPDGLSGEEARSMHQWRVKADRAANSATNRTVPTPRPRRPIREAD